MKGAHKLTLGATVLVIIIAGAGVFLFSSLDSLVAAAIEKYGSQVTQTPVRVDGVKIGVTSGEGAISGLTVGNPEGFSAPAIFSLGNIKSSIDVATISESTIVVKEINIDAPKVFYEINESGDSNLDALKKNIAAASKGGESSDSGDAPKLVIKRLTISNGEVDARIAALGDKSLSADLPNITLKNIGKSQSGASPSEIAEKVLSAIMKKSRSAVTNLDLDKYLGKDLAEIKQLGSKLGDKLEGSSTEETLKKGGDALKGLFK